MLFCITLYNYGIANVFLFLYSHCFEFYDSCNNNNSFKYIIYLCHQSYQTIQMVIT